MESDTTGPVAGAAPRELRDEAAAARGLVLALGDLNVDELIWLDSPAPPPPGGEAAVRQVCRRIGGSAANFARVLARLGVPVALAAATGRDEEGNAAAQWLSRSGVDSRLVQQDPQLPTGHVRILVDKQGERTMLCQRGAGAALRWTAELEQALRGASWLHVSGYAFLGGETESTARQALALAQELGIPVSLDPGAMAAASPAFAGKILGFLAYAAFAFPNESEAAALQQAEKRGKLWVEALAPGGWAFIKQGTLPCRLEAAAGGRPSLEVPLPLPPVAAENSTGAGDAFAAGAVAALLRGWPVDEAAVTGHLTAAWWLGEGAAQGGL